MKASQTSARRRAQTTRTPGTTRLSPEGRYLVTGAAGFIGSALVHGLNRRGITRIIVTDHLGSDQKWRNLAPL